jgi:hypothetical protein
MNAIVWTCLGAVGTALIGAFMTKLVNYIFERSANLIVTVEINQSFRSPLLAEEIWDLRLKSLPREEMFKAGAAFSAAKYNDYFKASQYIRLNLKNNSKKKLVGLSFCAHSVSVTMMQIGEGELVAVSSDVPVPLGDLQPKRDMSIHLLVSYPSGHGIKFIKQSLVFSADELGRVKYKFPLPPHFESRRNNRNMIAVAVALMIFFVASKLYLDSR